MPIDNEYKAVCSFCGKTQDEAERMISGPGGFICEECVQKMNIIDVNSKEYESIKDKVKKAIASKVLNLKDLE